MQAANTYDDSEYEDTHSDLIMTEYTLQLDEELVKEIVEATDQAPDTQEFKSYFVHNYDWPDYLIFDRKDEIVKEIPPVNYQIDKLISDVIDRLNFNYQGVIWSNYTDAFVDEDGNITDNSEDEKGNANKPVSIRISDYTLNPRNGRNFLNVLICNKNATASRFYTANTHLSFDENNTVDEIVEEILDYWK